MAEWKKIVVSGSAISQLNNDSNYLVVTDTIDSASVAARATTLSADATASFANRATSASIADELSQLATASHALTAVTASHALNVPDTASFALNADSASVAARATTLSADATASIADRATTASFADLASDARTADSASVAARATTLSGDATASFADRATTASFADLAGALRTGTTASFADRATSASIADEASTLSATATASIADRATTASFADLAGNSRNADSSSVAARATTLSSDATASFADRATSASIADDIKDLAVTNAKIAVGTIANDRLVNDSVTIGATEIELGATATTIAGLTSISAQTGSFVLQIFESSSTIITSGSNIFGDTQLDIQQFTGSILQTGSFTTTGTVTADEISSDKISGSFSGSFEGDGSGLTGLATTLTVDGDTGTQDVDLVNDDLQIIGTANEIETAVTKVGNDVKVTVGLPASITVTASLATKADSLASTATASQADSATSASIADEASTLSATATASFADSATTASIADELSGLATASIADRATTASQADSATTASIADELSGLATASIADTATTASHAITAVSASATVAGVLFPVADGLVNQALVTDGAGQFTYGDIFGTGSTKKLDQSVAAVTWSFQHDLNELYPIVQVYDSTGDQLIPERVESIDVNNVKLYFATATAGVAAAMVGGMGISASNATRATTASIADELSGLATASIADTATSASHAETATLARAGSGSFSGSFQGDGSDLTGIATTLTIDADSGGTSTVDLQTQTLDVAGTAGEIETSVSGQTITVGLPNNVTIGNNLTVTNDATITGDLTVGGSIVSASSLAVEDQFIILASGSNGAIDGGIIVNQIDDHPDGKGVAFAYDSSANRWALQTGLNDTASVITPDAHMGVIQESAGAPASDPTYGGTAGKGTIFVDTSANEAYIYI